MRLKVRGGAIPMITLNVAIKSLERADISGRRYGKQP